jgi:hypothetical protein
LTGENNPDGLEINSTSGALFGSTSNCPWEKEWDWDCYCYKYYVEVKVKVTDDGCEPLIDEQEFKIDKPAS